MRLKLTLIASAIGLSLLAHSASAAPVLTPAFKAPVMVAQASNDTRSSSSTRIPRGMVKLAVGGVVLLVGAAGWVINKLRGED